MSIPAWTPGRLAPPSKEEVIKKIRKRLCAFCKHQRPAMFSTHCDAYHSGEYCTYIKRASTNIYRLMEGTNE